MQTIVLDVPESVEMNEQQIRMFVAAKLYEAGRLNSGQAAEMVGMMRREFLERLGEYGVSIYDQTIEEVLQDAKNAEPFVKREPPENGIKGILKQYANPALVEQEKEAWANAVKEKHGETS